MKIKTVHCPQTTVHGGKTIIDVEELNNCGCGP